MVNVGNVFIDATDNTRVHVVAVDAYWVELKTDWQLETGKGGLSMPRRMFEWDVEYGEYIPG